MNESRLQCFEFSIGQETLHNKAKALQVAKGWTCNHLQNPGLNWRAVFQSRGGTRKDFGSLTKRWLPC
jgi:hypothetical protein